jgi:long-chain acyl-CoA synthetase
MNFIENIFARLSSLDSASRPVLQEAHGDKLVAANGAELAGMIRLARAFLRDAGLGKGDRCGLLAPNSIQWVALDLAIMAEGGIVVPLYSRQAPSELVGMMKDCAPALLICADANLREGILREWSAAPRSVLSEEIFKEPAKENPTALQPPRPLADSDTVAIIYTSGTSGEPKGVMLTVRNLNHMLVCTGSRLDQLMAGHPDPEKVFHYLPFCFAGSWILLLSCLSRNATLTLSTDLNKLTNEIQLASPEYFLNVPILLERMRAKIEEQIEQRGGWLRSIYRTAKTRWMANHGVLKASGGNLPLWLARKVIFPSIRGKIGPNLRALICGSAALAKETQLFFMMLGIPVLQVYGLTETTAICTMDIPGKVTPGRVGPAIDGIEMMVGENDEVLARGPHVFAGYWNRPEATAQAMRDGWFHTGDQGAVDSSGNWSITGRLKNLLILASGHNVAPEPIEEKLLLSIPGAQQVVLVGHGRKHLTALINGKVERTAVDAAIAGVNEAQPHYKRVHAYHVAVDPFTIESGLLTANGKLKRDVINERFHDEIEMMYRKQEA